MLDFCLEPGKIEALRMLDLQTKSTIKQNKLQVQHQATNLQPPPHFPISISCVPEQFFL
jgi:hypothetical protein